MSTAIMDYEKLVARAERRNGILRPHHIHTRLYIVTRRLPQSIPAEVYPLRAQITLVAACVVLTAGWLWLLGFLLHLAWVGLVKLAGGWAWVHLLGGGLSQ